MYILCIIFYYYYVGIIILQFGQGKVDLEEYIFTVLATANASSELDKVEIAFDVSANCLTLLYTLLYIHICIICKLLFLLDYIVL